MANANYNIDKFLGVNAGGTDLKKGELADMLNFKVVDGYDVQKRSGYTALLDSATAEPIQGQWYGKIGSTYYHIFASNGHIYQNDGDGTVTDLGTLTDAPTNFFYFNDAVYIQNGAEYKKWTGTGTISDVVGHIPLIATATLPAGGGTDYEGVNLLTNKRRQQFNGDAASTEYVLREQNITSVDYVYVGGGLKTVTTHYTVDLVLGKVTFTGGNTPPTGVNNVEIYWTNDSKTEYFDGTGNIDTFTLEETGISAINSITINGVAIKASLDITAVSTANNTLTVGSAHTLSVFEPIWFTTTGTLPAPLVAGTVYYGLEDISTRFFVHSQPSASQIDITSEGTGTHTVHRYSGDLVNGQVTLKTVAGSKNVKIVYTSPTTNASLVSQYTNANLYGGANDNRIFLYGGSNRIIYSGLADGVPSAEYFPATHFIDVGRKNENVTQLSTQYDRQFIFKEHSTSWCQYEYDSSLGVTFPTYPLNDSVGCTYTGTGQVIENNPLVLYGKNLYEIFSSYARDERYIKYKGQRIQALLDALTITGIVTLDNEAEREYWLAIGKNAFVYRFDLDVWYVYEFADTVSSLCRTADGVCIGTTGGQLMLCDDSLTDNGTAIESYIETDWLDYNAPAIKKYMDFIWVDAYPVDDSSLYVSFAVNYQPDERDTGAVGFDEGTSPQVTKVRVKAKKFNSIKLYFRNNDEDSISLRSLILPVSFGQKSR